MLNKEDNELLTQIGPGTPMGDLMRQYWVPIGLSSELPEPDCAPVRIKILGEELVAFRDTQGRIGLLDQFCPHQGASLAPTSIAESNSLLRAAMAGSISSIVLRIARW